MAEKKQTNQGAPHLRYAYEEKGKYGILPAGSPDCKVVWKEMSHLSPDFWINALRNEKVESREPRVSFNAPATMDILYDIMQMACCSDPRKNTNDQENQKDTAFKYAAISSGASTVTSYEGTPFIMPDVNTVWRVDGNIRTGLANAFDEDAVASRKQAAVAGLAVVKPVSATWYPSDFSGEGADVPNTLRITKADAFKDVERDFGWMKGMLVGCYPYSHNGAGVSLENIKRWNLKGGSENYAGDSCVIDAGIFRIKSIDDNDLVLEWGSDKMPDGDNAVNVLESGDVDSLFIAGCHAIGDEPDIVSTSWERFFPGSDSSAVKVARGCVLESLRLSIPYKGNAEVSLSFLGQDVNYLNECVSDNSAATITNPRTGQPYGDNHDVFSPCRNSQVNANLSHWINLYEINDNGSKGNEWMMFFKYFHLTISKNSESERILDPPETYGLPHGKPNISIEGKCVVTGDQQAKGCRRLGAEIVIGNQEDGYLGIVLPYVEPDRDGQFGGIRTARFEFKGIAKSSPEHGKHCMIISRIPYLPPFKPPAQHSPSP